MAKQDWVGIGIVLAAVLLYLHVGETGSSRHPFEDLHLDPH